MASPSKARRLHMPAGDKKNYLGWSADAQQEQNDRGLLRGRIGYRRTQEFKNGVHGFQMILGIAPVGPVVYMTGAEAIARNRALERRFIAAMDAKKPARLSKWRLVQRDVDLSDQLCDTQRAGKVRPE